MKKIDPNIPKNMSRLATFASAKVRLRKKRIGSIGWAVCSSHATKATRSAMPAANDPTTGAAQRQAGEVERRGGAPALVEAPQDERHEHQSEGDVEPEDPVPGDPRDD